MKRALLILILLLTSQSLWAAERAPKKIGVLLVSHGSRSQTWRESLTDLEGRVRVRMLAEKSVAGLKTAFMEYTEPSIATRLKEFDAEGYTDVVLVPIFLTVSPHTFDDIPTIIGTKEDPASLQVLKMEKIERYKPNARTHLAPPLDFSQILQANVLRRVGALSRDPENESLVLIAYGDNTYREEWEKLLARVSAHVKRSTGISSWAYAWCGHLVHYNPEETTRALQTVLAVKKTAIVIPVLVAYDEMFQVKIIGNGIARIPNHKTRVLYRPDSILPDENVEKWVLETAREYVRKIKNG